MAVTNIQPNSRLYILQNVPLDATYTDTMDFANVSAQVSFFQGKAKYPVLDMTVTKSFSNGIRVPFNSDQLFDCNYIMFQNTNYGTKWFFAFITGISNMSPNSSNISFEIDVFQTWQFDIQFGQCFVERQHVAVSDDIVGHYTTNENLDLGRYMIQNPQRSGNLDVNDIRIVVASSMGDSESQVLDGAMYGGIYSGVQYLVYDNVDGVNQFINGLTVAGKADAIVSIFMYHNNFISEPGQPSRAHAVNIPKNIDGYLDNYMPVNNKMYTYPYNFLSVTNGEGNFAEFRYEDFRSSDCGFTMVGEMTCNPTIALYPRLYRAGSGIVPQNLFDKITLSGFPQCAYVTDSYKNWLALNGSSQAVSALASTAALVGGIVSANPAAVGGGLMGITNSIIQNQQAQMRPPQASGSQGSSNNYANGVKDFWFYNLCVNRETAQRIDTYFTMYGYAIKTMQTPDFKNRPNWNFIKTIDSKITGSVPFNHMSKIKQIFDNGVTVWHGDYVGDYGRGNGR